jgi:hypothetical protein
VVEAAIETATDDVVDQVLRLRGQSPELTELADSVQISHENHKRKRKLLKERLERKERESSNGNASSSASSSASAENGSTSTSSENGSSTSSENGSSSDNDSTLAAGAAGAGNADGGADSSENALVDTSAAFEENDSEKYPLNLWRRMQRPVPLRLLGDIFNHLVVLGSRLHGGGSAGSGHHGMGDATSDSGEGGSEDGILKPLITEVIRNIK